MTIGITDKAIETLQNIGCVVYSVQLPFIIFSIHDTFYKCKMSTIIKNKSIWLIIKHSTMPLTIKDIK